MPRRWSFEASLASPCHDPVTEAVGGLTRGRAGRTASTTGSEEDPWGPGGYLRT